MFFKITDICCSSFSILLFFIRALVVESISESSIGLFELFPDKLGFNHEKLEGFEIAGMGDFNSDKSTDLVLISSDRLKIKILFYNEKDKTFQENGDTWEISSEHPIVNVVPGDWNFDGQLDLLLMKKITKGELDLSVHLGFQEGFDSRVVSLPSSSEIQPMVIDFNGDMKPDLLGYSLDNSGKKLKLTLWQNIASGEHLDPGTSEKITLFEVKYLDPITMLPTSDFSNEVLGTEAMCTWGSPHSNAFIDLDGDCLPDIFVTCDDGSFQVWLNTKPNPPENNAGKFVQRRRGTLPKNSGPITFADLRGEGSLDMIFSTCDSSGCTLNLVENSQMPLCASISEYGGKCREQGELCSSDPLFEFQFDKPGHRKLALSELVKDTKFADKKFILSDMPSFSVPLVRPIPIRAGDFNIDGFPDLMLTISNRASSDQNSDLSVIILQSVQCTKDICSGEVERKRTYQLLSEAAQPVIDSATSLAGHFFDFKDDGSLDLLLISWNKDKSQIELNPFSNNFQNDAFFLKAMVSSGSCSRSCSSGGPPYGSNQYGATIKVVVTDSTNNFHAHQSVQLPQSSYYSFQAPYCHIGLGRINNYLQTLVIGSSRHNQKEHFHPWSNVVPNSQLVILPYQSPGTDNPEEWTRELFLNPGKAALWVLLTLTLCMAVLASVVAGMTWAEKREDEKERRRAIHHINFGSL